jgi:hypothetical protein
VARLELLKQETAVRAVAVETRGRAVRAVRALHTQSFLLKTKAGFLLLAQHEQPLVHTLC